MSGNATPDGGGGKIDLSGVSIGGAFVLAADCTAKPTKICLTVNLKMTSKSQISPGAFGLVATYWGGKESIIGNAATYLSAPMCGTLNGNGTVKAAAIPEYAFYFKTGDQNAVKTASIALSAVFYFKDGSKTTLATLAQVK